MWVLIALLISFISSIYFLAIQNIKINANLFVLYRGWIISLMLLPVLLLNPVTFSFAFYVMSFVQGIFISYMDYQSFNVNKNYGAETVSSMMPFSVVLIFVFWCMIDPTLFMKYCRTPVRTCFILLSLVGIIFSLCKYYQVKFTRSALIKIFPVLFFSACIAIINKSIMNFTEGNTLIRSCYGVALSSIVVGIVHLFMYIHQKLPLKKIIAKENLQKSTILFLLLLIIVLKNIAFYYVDNPAYVSCLTYIMLIWIMILGKYVKCFAFKNKEIQTAKKWKIIFVFSIILLIIATN